MVKRAVVTKQMLEDLCNRQHERLVEQDAAINQLTTKHNKTEQDLLSLEHAAKKLSKRFIKNYKYCVKLTKYNRDLGIQNNEFLRDRNDVIRKYNFLVQSSQFISREELAEWNRKLPENKNFNGSATELKADLLESGKVRYRVQLKTRRLPSGKTIKLATQTEKEKDDDKR